jgi:hypothetical protein
MSEDEMLEEFVAEIKKVEPVAHMPAASWQDWIPTRLTPDTMTGLAMTKHFINTPAEEWV